MINGTLSGMGMCASCGWLYELTSEHKCSEPIDIPANKRTATNYQGNISANLSRGDKEQLDRIEAKLNQLLGIDDITPSEG